ncbi:MAG: SpoIID/LytB domain-containing protein [bacterium]
MNILFIMRTLICFVFLFTSSSFAKKTRHKHNLKQKTAPQEIILRDLPCPLTIIKEQKNKQTPKHKKHTSKKTAPDTHKLAQNSSCEPIQEKLQKNTPEKPTITTLPQSCPNIRVLIDEQDALPKSIFTLSSKHGLLIEQEDIPKQKYPEKKLTLSIEKNKLYLLDNNAKKNKYSHVTNDSLTIYPKQGRIFFNNQAYEGALTLHIDRQSQKILIINKLNIDDYIYAVLGCESLPFWPLEMHKVQAIISRTYAIYQMRQSRNLNKKQPYDIKTSNIHQVYNGSHQLTHLREAVSDTHNLILMYRNTVALTMFDVCCGGVITDNIKTKDSCNPYLYRKNRCLYCANKKDAHWERNFTEKTLFSQIERNPNLKKTIKKIGIIKDIEIKNKDKAGIVQSLKLIGSRANAVITTNQFNSCLTKKLKSKVFTMKKKKNDIILSGFGYGHCLGLCQLGAQEMVKQGCDFKEVLAFYYPGTKFARLTPKSAQA